MLAAVIGAVLAIVGATVVAVALLRRRQPDQLAQTLPVVSGLVVAALGVVALSAATLANDDDENGDEARAGLPDRPMPDDTRASDGTPPDDTDPEQPSSPPPTRAPLPECFDQHLTRDPIVREENRLRLQEGVNVPVAPTIATALILQEDDEVLGVVRVIHEPLGDDYVHVYDAVDAACEPIPDARPQNTLDDVEETTRTTLALRINDRNYTLTIDGVVNGSSFDTTLTRTPQGTTTSTTVG